MQLRAHVVDHAAAGATAASGGSRTPASPRRSGVITSWEKYGGTAPSSAVDRRRRELPAELALPVPPENRSGSENAGHSVACAQPVSTVAVAREQRAARSALIHSIVAGVATFAAWTITSISPATPVRCSSALRSRSAGMFCGTSLVMSDSTARLGVRDPAERRPARAPTASTRPGRRTAPCRAAPGAAHRGRAGCRRPAVASGAPRRRGRRSPASREELAGAAQRRAEHAAVAVGEHQRRRAGGERARQRDRDPDHEQQAEAADHRHRREQQHQEAGRRRQRRGRDRRRADRGRARDERRLAALAVGSRRSSATRDWNWIA